MKRIAMTIAAAGLALPAQLAITTPAQAGYNNIDDFCKAYVATGEEPMTNIGECVSLLTVQFHARVDGKGGNSYAQHACDYYEEVAPEFFYSNWDSKQDCMDQIFD